MIVVTGAAGFIGSALISYLISKGHHDVVAVDDFHRLDKNKNLRKKDTLHLVHRDEAIDWIEKQVDQNSIYFSPWCENGHD